MNPDLITSVMKSWSEVRLVGTFKWWYLWNWSSDRLCVWFYDTIRYDRREFNMDLKGSIDRLYFTQFQQRFAVLVLWNLFLQEITELWRNLGRYKRFFQKIANRTLHCKELQNITYLITAFSGAVFFCYKVYAIWSGLQYIFIFCVCRST